MGSLAKWGAIAGAAKGWSEGSKTEEDRKQHRLDQEREERLLQLKHDRTVSREDVAHERSTAAAKTSDEQAASMQEDRQVQQTSEREAGQEFTADESALERENRLGVAGINQAGQAARSGANKWSYKRKEATTSMDEEGNLVTTPGEMILTDPNTQISYVQKGNMFRLDGDTSAPRPPRERDRAEKKLTDNASFEAGKMYMDKFGYLPISFFHALKQKGLVADEGEGQPTQ